MKTKILSLLPILFVLGFVSCGGGEETGNANTEPPKSMVTENEDEAGDAMSNKGIGPISSVELGAVDNALSEEGGKVFEAKCTACHKIGKKHIGPNLTGVTTRRSPEWIMNMILNPDEMVKEDPIAKKLLIEYNGSPMANQSLSEDEARAVLEYFRTNE